MDAVFVSHAKDDQYFVTLFTALLKFHGIEVPFCLSNSDESADAEYTGEMAKAVDGSDALIVVLSKYSEGAQWVTRDVSYFKNKKPGDDVIFVLLDPVRDEEIHRATAPYRCIDFYSCMLTGFQELHSCLGPLFLKYPDRREKADRRAHMDVDRRKSPIIQRMRKGFWLGYAAASGYSKFDTVILDYHLRHKIMASLSDESKKYRFSDKEGNSFDFNQVLDQTTLKIWDILKERGEIKAVIVIEAIAEEIHRSFTVEPIEQRRESRRRSDAC